MFSNFFGRNFAFTKFLLKKCSGEFNLHTINFAKKYWNKKFSTFLNLMMIDEQYAMTKDFQYNFVFALVKK